MAASSRSRARQTTCRQLHIHDIARAVVAVGTAELPPSVTLTERQSRAAHCPVPISWQSNFLGRSCNSAPSSTPHVSHPTSAVNGGDCVRVCARAHARVRVCACVCVCVCLGSMCVSLCFFVLKKKVEAISRCGARFLVPWSVPEVKPGWRPLVESSPIPTPEQSHSYSPPCTSDERP